MTIALPASFDLTDRVAVVTGGGGLLGVEHGHALAQLGAIVVLADIDKLAAQSAASTINDSAYPGRALGAFVDVANESSVGALSSQIAEELGEVKILVNNAAIDPKVKAGAVIETSRLENLSLEQWRLQLDVGLTGAFLCAKVFGTQMAAARRGVILNIASDLAVIAPDQRLYRLSDRNTEKQPVKPVTYSVIKTGLIGLTRYLATYWATEGVRCNAISPGGVFNSQGDEFVERLSALIPLGRMARREEYRAAVQFLCADASSYMTGQNVVVDGGRSVW